MKKLNGRDLKALILLSVVLPVSLLVSFRLTGVLEEPPAAERITIEPVTLNLSRPSETSERINKSVQNKWIQEGTSIIAGVKVLSYHEGAAEAPFWGHDGLVFKTYINASFAQGRLSTVKISFRPLDGNAVLFVSEERWDLRLDNATLTAIHYWGTNETEAYIKANVLNSPCSVSDQIFWVFLDENESHELQITLEVMHTHETAAKIITIPIILKLAPSEGT